MCGFMAQEGTLREREERLPELREVVPRRAEEIIYTYIVEVEGVGRYRISWAGEGTPTAESMLANRDLVRDEMIQIMDESNRPMLGVETSREVFFTALETAVSEGKEVKVAKVASA